MAAITTPKDKNYIENLNPKVIYTTFKLIGHMKLQCQEFNLMTLHYIAIYEFKLMTQYNIIPSEKN